MSIIKHFFISIRYVAQVSQRALHCVVWGVAYY